MKRFFNVLAAVLLMANVFAQTPEKMSYQAVIRNSSNKLVTNQQVGIQISILQGSTSGTVVYTETQTPTTNANGLVSIEIGGGAGFSTIDWANGSFFIKTETDPDGGANYTITGTSQILSVPYAIHAKTAENTFSGNYNDLSNKPDANQWTDVSNGISYQDGRVSVADINIKDSSEIFFQDYGQIRSTDNNHRILFRRSENILEMREYGDIVFSSGSTDGNATNQMTLQYDGTLQLNNKTIQNVANPINDQDAATKGYVDAIGTITEIDPIYTSSEAANITETDITNLGNLSGSNTGDQDGSETKVTAGTNISVTGSGTTASPYVVNATGATTLAIGDSYDGGIIFYLDASGQHGLIAATTDQSTGIQWYNGSITYTIAFASSVGGGDENTSMIVYNQGTGSYAARLCYDLFLNGYNDWYLPSKYELNLMYMHIGNGNLMGLGNVGDFATYYYWSSTERTNIVASFQLFTNGGQGSNHKHNTYYVRAIRAF